MSMMTILLFAVLAVMGAAVICIAVMFVSISKAGDERRRHIVEKACGGTFLITLGMLIISVMENLVLVFLLQREIHRINPFILLMVISVVYAVQLVYYRKKFGD